MGFARDEIEAVDERVRREVDDATDVAEASPPPQPLDALVGVYAEPPAVDPLWFRAGVRSAVERHERPAGWGTFGAATGPAGEGR